MACDPEELMAEAACYACIQPNQRALAIVALLCLIEESGGGGGGGSVDVEDEGVPVVSPASVLNFIGDGVTVTDAGGGRADITIPGGGGSSGVNVEDKGTPVLTPATTLDFIGDVTVTDAGGGTAAVTIPQRVFANAGNPNGVVSATGPALCMDSTNGVLYWKTTAGTSNNEWT
jgi:hypothetical protein